MGIKVGNLISLLTKLVELDSRSVYLYDEMMLKEMADMCLNPWEAGAQASVPRMTETKKLLYE